MRHSHMHDVKLSINTMSLQSEVGGKAELCQTHGARHREDLGLGDEVYEWWRWRNDSVFHLAS